MPTVFNILVLLFCLCNCEARTHHTRPVDHSGLGPITNSRQRIVSKLGHEIAAANLSLASKSFSKTLPIFRDIFNRASSIFNAEFKDLAQGKDPNGPQMLGTKDLSVLYDNLSGVSFSLLIEAGSQTPYTTQQLSDARKVYADLENLQSLIFDKISRP